MATNKLNSLYVAVSGSLEALFIEDVTTYDCFKKEKLLETKNERIRCLWDRLYYRLFCILKSKTWKEAHPEQNFIKTEEYRKWIHENCSFFGFISDRTADELKDEDLQFNSETDTFFDSLADLEKLIGKAQRKSASNIYLKPDLEKLNKIREQAAAAAVQVAEIAALNELPNL